jgi:site-specific DNA-adenine methylase
VADLVQALANAREALRLFAPDAVFKTIWGSPMGKTHLARRIVAEIPEHRVYVEPFAGGAKVLFTKDPSEVEVVADLDPEIAFAFKFTKNITPEQIARLRRKKWVGDKDHFKRLEQSEIPDDDLERFYRFAYLSRFSFNKLRRGTMPDKLVGVEARFVEKLERLAPRLRKVRVRHADYEQVIDELDSPDTFFFLDPPYAGYDADSRTGAGHKEWDEARFGAVLRKIRGKFLCTYGLRGDRELFKGFHVRRWRHVSGVGTTRGEGLRQSTTLAVTNYDPDKVRRFQVAVSKTIWGSPAGKKRLADRLAALLPRHKTYVEPFAGSAAVLFAKDPAEVEAVGDADPEIAEAYRIIKRLTRSELERLRRMTWTGDEATFKRLFDESPKDDVGRLHRFLYLTHFSYGKLRGRSFNPGSAGVEARTLDRVEAFAPRLKHVRIYGGDYEKVVRKYDAPDTVFFFDPPYAGYNVDVGEGEFDEERFFSVLKSLKGKFLLTYGIRGKLPGLLKRAGFSIQRIRTPRSISTMRGVGGSSVLTQLVVANYDLVSKGDLELEPWTGQLRLEDGADADSTDKAQWTRSYINDLPDSAFLHVEPGGHKDDEGKTVPRSLRHFPVRDAKGELDLPHLRNAIARMPQSRIPGLTADEVRALQDKARRLLAEAQEPEAKADITAPFSKAMPLIKGVDPDDERYVLGIVLEPEVVDAQGDIYSSDEIRQAAHLFMEDFGGLGLMHRMRVNGQVKVLESYLAPVDFAVGETRVRKGTWLLAVRILSDALWEQVKGGELTGFSIGGTARRYPTESPATDAAASTPNQEAA